MSTRINHNPLPDRLGSIGLVTLIFMGCGLFSEVPTPIPSVSQKEISTLIAATALASRVETFSIPSPTTTIETPPPTNTQFIPPTATSTEAPFLLPLTGASCIPNNPPQTGRVVDVVDGDTIKVVLDQDGLTYTVRYIGMDTPENTSQVEYFGPQATAKNFELVSGKTVALIKDVSETDRFGRLLRYVLTDLSFVNYELVAQGYANTASFPPDIACIDTFREVEAQAMALALGLWAAPPTLALVPTSVPSGGGNAPCNCSGSDLNCGDFSTHTSAQACHDFCYPSHGDVFGLDGNDNDGLACENLP